MSGPRIAVVADVHWGEDQGTKIGSAASALLPPIVEAIEARRPDLVVDLGDRVNSADATSDRCNLRHVADVFASLTAPRVHLVGNHDLDHLSLADNEAILGHTLRHHGRDLHGWRLVFWNPDCRYTPGRGDLRLTEEDLSWLETELTAHQAPTVVFSHAPVHAAPMDGNLYFERKPASRAWHANVEEATRMLERHAQVILCVNGHTHWNALSFRDGIAFATLPSLTESFTTTPHPAAAWAWLELGDSLSWTVHGHDAWDWRLPLRHPRRSWLKKDPTTGRFVPRGGA